MTIQHTFDMINFKGFPSHEGPYEVRWHGSDSEENFKNNVEGTTKSEYLESSFSYLINSHGMRCKEFDDIDFTKPTLVAIGCSFTFGTGIPQEAIWCEVLAAKLRSDGIDVQLVNLSAIGASFDFLTRIISVTKHLLKDADLIFGFLPDLTRTELYLSDWQSPENIHVNRSLVNDKLKNYVKNFVMDDS